MKTPNINKDPVESEVAYLFAFTLGFVSGINALRRYQAGNPPQFEDLHTGFSIAGSKLDELAGDAFLRSNAQWFLIEMKRGYPELSAELNKKRVQDFRERLRTEITSSVWEPILAKAFVAHQFLYLLKDRALPSPEMATLCYLEWLWQQPQEHRTPDYWKKKSQPFMSFLARAGRATKGFSEPELVKYIELLNASEIATGGLTALEIEQRVAIAVDEAGLVNAVTYRRLCQELNLDLAAERPEEDEPPEPKDSSRSSHHLQR